MMCPRLWTAGSVAATAIVCVLFAGCSENSAQVSGTVQLDGKPLTTGTVSFHPTGAGPVAYGQLDTTGNYELSTGTSAGLAVGTYVVTVTAMEMLPPENPQDETIPKLLTPPSYGDKSTSDLRAAVQPGKNRVPLELKSQP